MSFAVKASRFCYLGLIAGPLSWGLLSSAASASILANWTFENNTIGATAASFGPLSPATGSGSASGHHSSASTVWSSPAGNGSAKSFSSEHWAVGDYYQFSTSTLGLEDIQIGWDQTGSGTGPKDFKVQYSTDGSSFSDIPTSATYAVLLNGSPNPTWATSGSGLPSAAYSYTRDLSAITALDNASMVFLRLVDNSIAAINGTTVGTAGADRVDNFTISADTISSGAVPEASPLLVWTVLGCTVLAGWKWHRRLF